MHETLGDRIRIARARWHMSQAELARQIGISTTAMNAIETGGADPRASRIKRIAEVLGVSTDYLLSHAVRTPPTKPPRPRKTAPVG